jgi:hypothetical protein
MLRRDIRVYGVLEIAGRRGRGRPGCSYFGVARKLRPPPPCAWLRRPPPPWAGQGFWRELVRVPVATAGRVFAPARRTQCVHVPGIAAAPRGAQPAGARAGRRERDALVVRGRVAAAAGHAGRRRPHTRVRSTGFDGRGTLHLAGAPASPRPRPGKPARGTSPHSSKLLEKAGDAVGGGRPSGPVRIC